MKEKGDSRYKRFIETAFREVSRVLRSYSDRFSKKTYTQRQLAVAVLLMKYEDKTYRDITDLLVEFADYFEFKNSTPHFTTLQKFFLRIPTYVWEFLLTKTYELFAGDVANVAIDSTGYRLHHASQHYEQRTGRKRNRRCFMKYILSIDSDSQAIIVSESRRSCINDNITFRPILKKTKDIVDVDNTTADKGYDSEENHRFAHKKIGANSVIPLRYEIPLRRTTGLYLESTCPEHGRYGSALTESTHDFVDINTPLRNVIKEALFIEEAKAKRALDLMVDDGDWVHMPEYVVSEGLALLGYSYKDRPSRFFAPIIEDWSGAKFSKSVYVEKGTYGYLPAGFLNLVEFKKEYGNGYSRLHLH
jgi:hypothetical protein